MAWQVCKPYCTPLALKRVCFRPEIIEWFTEVQAFSPSYDSAPPLLLPSASCLSFSIFLPVDLTDGRAGDEAGKEPKIIQYDREKTWSSINNSILSGFYYIFHLSNGGGGTSFLPVLILPLCLHMLLCTAGAYYVPYSCLLIFYKFCNGGERPEQGKQVPLCTCSSTGTWNLPRWLLCIKPPMHLWFIQPCAKKRLWGQMGGGWALEFEFFGPCEMASSRYMHASKT
jgi:hypothetical protein